MFKQLVFVLLLINLSTSSVFARVPPRNSPATAEETVAVDAVKAKEESPTESNPVEKTPVSETGAAGNDEESSMLDKPRKPIGVILFRTQPQISIFRDRSPFGPTFGSDLQPFPGLHAPHFGLRNGFGHDDPAIRLLSILFGDRRLRPLGQPIESGESEPANASSESSAESSETDRREVHPFESLFPNIFVPRFPPVETEKEGEPTTNNEEKTPANFENKEKKVINIGGRKFVKTTQTKKVKNDFGEFHSMISSYQPFDEKLHDENGNEKNNPEETGVDKKDVSPANKEPVEPVTSAKPSESSTASEQADLVPSSSTEAPPAVEKDETPELKVKADEPDEKQPAESLSKVDESKNEIPDKAEIKVDQMS